MKQSYRIAAVITAAAAAGLFPFCIQGPAGPRTPLSEDVVYPEMQPNSTLNFRSRYNGTVVVIDEGGVRSLKFRSRDSLSTQSTVDLRRPSTLQFRYTMCCLLGLVYHGALRREPGRVLMIGLGGGSLLRFMQEYHPGTAVDTVELDPVVVDVARRYFLVRDTPRTAIHVADGRRFVETTTQTYDMIIVDAFNADSDIPRPLASVEFLRELKKRLAPGGVVVTNFINNDERVYDALVATYRQSFVRVKRFNLIKYDKCNIIMIAFDDERMNLTRDDLVARARAYARTLREPYDLGDIASLCDDSPPPGAPGVIHD